MALQNSSLRLSSDFVRHFPKILVRWKTDSKQKTEKYQLPPECAKHETVYDSCPDIRDRGIHADACDANNVLEQPRVIIVGAGLAGLSAAARLNDHGITNYMILEAYARPGGRILSGWLGDVPIELGSSWGKDTCTTHPVFKIQSLENPPLPSGPVVNQVCALFSRYDVEKPSFPIMYMAYKKFKQIEDEAKVLFRNGGSKQQGSIINFLSIRIQQELHCFPEEWQYDAAKVMFGLCHILSSRSPVDTSMLACDSFGYYMKIPGGNVRVPLGAIGMMAPLIKKITLGNIQYCKPVTCIYWGTNQKSGYRAVVRTANGEEFFADYVITTMSLCCLWCYSQTLFCPALPCEKLDAIARLGHCHTNKIYLEYAQPFWYWQKTNLNLNFAPNELTHRPDWTCGLTSINIVQNSKYVLAATVKGEAARYMESCSDKDIVENITHLLQSTTGSNIPYPISVLRSRWSSDPYFLCAYSFDKENVCGAYQQALASPLPGSNEPVPPILLFAGEATVPRFAGSPLQAAIISGIREAERIVDLTLKYKGPPVRDFPIHLPTNRICQVTCPKCIPPNPPCPCDCDDEQSPPPLPRK